MGFLSGWKRSAPEQDLYQATMRRDWEVVLELYTEFRYTFPELIETTFTNSGDTLLHLAAIHGMEDIVAKLVGLIKDTDEERYRRILSAQNKRKDTALHCAASRGSLAMCRCMINNEQLYSSLVHIRNSQQETPLFLAALNGHKQTFLYLHSVSAKCESSNGNPWRRIRGEAILHCTLEREYFGNPSPLI